jgi:hypothetical protein
MTEATRALLPDVEIPELEAHEPPVPAASRPLRPAPQTAQHPGAGPR